VNVLFMSDGSDGGYKSTGTLAQIIERQAINKLRITLVEWPQLEWPQHKSALWSKAYDLWLAEDDLHRAMEIAAEREFARFKALFQDRALSIEPKNADGDPIEQVLTNAGALDAGLILLAITGDLSEPEVRDISSEIIGRSQAPVIVAYGDRGRGRADDRLAE
jgi:hypothetical protein